ncbi:MAG: hypothetical protein ACI4OA_02945 [Selenomonadaceae bacterium]
MSKKPLEEVYDALLGKPPTKKGHGKKEKLDKIEKAEKKSKQKKSATKAPKTKLPKVKAAMEDVDEPKKRISFSCGASVSDALHSFAEEQGMTLTAVIEDAVTSYMKAKTKAKANKKSKPVKAKKSSIGSSDEKEEG